jgi:hypothetical protein
MVSGSDVWDILEKEQLGGCCRITVSTDDLRLPH